MRSRWMTLVALTGLLLTPQLAAAEDEMQAQMQIMQDRMAQLEEKLDATNDELDSANTRVDQQQVLIDQAGLDDRAGSSALSRFLEQTEFTGHVAASYNQNFNDPSRANLGTQVNTVTGVNNGALGIVAPYHQNANSFQLDQLWFGMHKPSTAESRGGFRADIVFGASADALRVGSIGGTVGGASDFTGDSPELYQAYVSYLAPIGNGVEIKVGRWATYVGAENFDTTQNFNITRGLLFGVQPVNHTGVTGSTTFGEGFDVAWGVSNNNSNDMFTSDDTKAYHVHAGWGNDTVTLGVNGVLGGDAPPTYLIPGGVGAGTGPGFNKDRSYLLDAVATWDPSDDLSMWLNFDYNWWDNDGLPSFNLWGIAAAGRYSITETTGFSLRGEFVQANDLAGGLCAGCDDIDIFSVTGTLDHSLTDSLTLRGEVRYDMFNMEGAGGVNDFFINSNAAAGTAPQFTDKSQVLAVVQMMYEF